jgi:hypothetical protein
MKTPANVVDTDRNEPFRLLQFIQGLTTTADQDRFTQMRIGE